MKFSAIQEYLYASPLRKHLFLAGLTIVTLTVLYIVKSIVDGVSLGLMDQSYRNGQADAVDLIIAQSSGKDCKPFNVHVDDRKAYLVNLECVQTQAGGAGIGVVRGDAPAGGTTGGTSVGTNGSTYIQGGPQ